MREPAVQDRGPTHSYLFESLRPPYVFYFNNALYPRGQRVE